VRRKRQPAAPIRIPPRRPALYLSRARRKRRPEIENQRRRLGQAAVEPRCTSPLNRGGKQTPGRRPTNLASAPREAEMWAGVRTGPDLAAVSRRSRRALRRPERELSDGCKLVLPAIVASTNNPPVHPLTNGARPPGTPLQSSAVVLGTADDDRDVQTNCGFCFPPGDVLPPLDALHKSKRDQEVLCRPPGPTGANDADARSCPIHHDRSHTTRASTTARAKRVPRWPARLSVLLMVDSGRAARSFAAPLERPSRAAPRSPARRPNPAVPTNKTPQSVPLRGALGGRVPVDRVPPRESRDRASWFLRAPGARRGA